MFLKKFLIFTAFCFYGNSCLADYITFDTVALDTAINEITRVGSESPYKTVEEAADALYDAFYAAKKGNTVDSDVVMEKCFNEIVKSGRICNNFITTYNTNLNHANYCMKANKERITPTYSAPGKENQQEYNFQECTSIASGEKFHNVDGTTSSESYHGESYLGKCIDWVNDAEQCQSYLIGYYKSKIEDSGVSKMDKQRYECVLNKLQTGNLEFPTSKMEESCK